MPLVWQPHHPWNVPTERYLGRLNFDSEYRTTRLGWTKGCFLIVYNNIADVAAVGVVGRRVLPLLVLD